MRSHKITVTVDQGSIQVVPETLIMTSDDEVSWAGTNARKFSVVFDTDGPFGSRELAHHVASGKLRPRAHGRFKYTVVSADDPSLKLDPVVIVDHPPTGSKP